MPPAQPRSLLLLTSLPPLTLDASPLASHPAPPLTLENWPLASLTRPPPTLAYSPLAAFGAAPAEQAARNRARDGLLRRLPYLTTIFWAEVEAAR